MFVRSIAGFGAASAALDETQITRTEFLGEEAAAASSAGRRKRVSKKCAMLFTPYWSS